MCVVCRTHTTPDNLIRIVCRNGEISVDRTGKVDGRGAYICQTLQCAQTCKKRGSLNRAFNTTVADSVYDALIAAVEDNQGV